MRRSAYLIAPAAFLIAALASGCGSATKNTIDPVAKAAEATTSTHGSRIAMNMTMSSAALPRPLHMKAGGVLDQRTRKGEIELDMADFAGLAGTDASKFHMTEILDGTVVYMRMPLLDGKLPGGKKWMKMDLQKLTKAFGVNLSQITQSGQDPAQQLGYLRTVADAKKVGSENVRGVPTTHYHGVARLDRYPELLPPDQRAAAREGIQRLIKVSGTSTMPVDAWIDKQGLIRRMRMAMNMKIPTIGQSMKMEIQEELFDFGTNVSVKPPPAKDVYDASGTINDALKQSGLGG